MKKRNSIIQRLKGFFILAAMITALALVMTCSLSAQESGFIKVLDKAESIKPLDQIEVVCTIPGTLVIKDAAGRIYYQSATTGRSTVTVAGKTGQHTIVLTIKRIKSWRRQNSRYIQKQPLMTAPKPLKCSIFFTMACWYMIPMGWKKSLGMEKNTGIL